MSQNFQAGDFLVFQLEAGYGLLRLLGIEQNDSDRVWHLAAYDEFFPDVESAEAAVGAHHTIKVLEKHIPLTTRAFDSTQVAQLGNAPLSDTDVEPIRAWQSDPQRVVFDRSIRLMLGLR